MKRATIGLLGPYGYGNLGDAAIQDAMLAYVRRWRPGARIIGLSLNPEDTTERHGIPAYRLRPHRSGPVSISPAPASAPRNAAKPSRPEQPAIAARMKDALRRSPAIGRVLTPMLSVRDWVERVGMEIRFSVQAWRILREFELLVISGGGQLDDSWGGPWCHPFSMFRWAALARLAGARVTFVSIGAGPLEARISRIFCRWALRMADYISYRDKESLEFVRRVLGLPDGLVAPDLAFGLDCPDTRSPVTPARYIAVGPMPWFDPRSWPEKDPVVYAAYLDRMQEIVAGLVDRGYQVVLFPSDIHMDELVIHDLLALLAERAPEILPRVSFQPCPTVSTLIGVLQGADLVLAARYHAALLAQLVATPVVALSYHPKVTSVMKDAGQSQYCLDLATAQVSEVLGRIDRLLGSLGEVRNELQQRVRGFRSRLEGQCEQVFGGPGTPVSKQLSRPAATADAGAHQSVTGAV